MSTSTFSHEAFRKLVFARFPPDPADPERPGISFRDLAEKIKLDTDDSISAGYLNQLFNGAKLNISMAYTMVLARFFGVSIEALVDPVIAEKAAQQVRTVMRLKDIVDQVRERDHARSVELLLRLTDRSTDLNALLGTIEQELRKDDS